MAMTAAERQRKRRASLTEGERAEVRRRDRERKRARWASMTEEEREAARERNNRRRRARRAFMDPEELAALRKRERLRKAAEDARRRAAEGLPPPRAARDLRWEVAREADYRCATCGDRAAADVRLLDPGGDPLDPENLAAECTRCRREREREERGR